MIDLEWRGTEGLKLAQLAHSLGHREQMAIILVAANELSRRTQASARKAGVNECVLKTPDMAGVTEAIKRLVTGDR
ncbi:MAG: hypothetical protein ABJB61_05915 [bacterium]